MGKMLLKMWHGEEVVEEVWEEEVKMWDGEEAVEDVKRRWVKWLVMYEVTKGGCNAECTQPPRPMRPGPEPSDMCGNRNYIRGTTTRLRVKTKNCFSILHV